MFSFPYFPHMQDKWNYKLDTGFAETKRLAQNPTKNDILREKGIGTATIGARGFLLHVLHT